MYIASYTYLVILTLRKEIFEQFENAGFVLEKIKAVDMFSYTQHVESVILMKRGR